MSLRPTILSLSLFILVSVQSTPVAAQDEAVGLIASASLDEGKRHFLRCKACHTIDKGAPNRLGPNLWGIVGRSKASVSGYNYSPVMKKLDGDWDYAALSAFLKNPRTFAPGNRMAFPGLKDPRQRAAVIAYLRAHATEPPPLPSVVAEPKAPPSPEVTEAEDFGGLPPGEGREETFAICGACHSLRLVTQQGLDAERWDALMDWMTEKQGMPELPQTERERIVSYLARHFGPESRGRQATDPMMPTMPAMPKMPQR